MFLSIQLSAFILFLRLVVASPSLYTRAPAAAPFGLEYVFSVNLTIGSVSKPIPIYGGVTITETISHGIVYGPAINATIEGGAAYANIYENQTIQVPSINAYGMTSDGLPFTVQETGIGSLEAQMTRIVRAALPFTVERLMIAGIHR